MSQDPFASLETALALFDERTATTFCATLSARMLNNYRFYCEMTASGDLARAEAIMALVWEALLTPASRIDFSLQADKLQPIEEALEQQAPSFGVSLAQHAVMALGICLETLASKRIGAATEISRLSRHDVENYIAATDDSGDNSSDDHPLWQDEVDFQQEVVLRLQQGDGKETLKALKALGHNGGVSNLGIATQE